MQIRKVVTRARCAPKRYTFNQLGDGALAQQADAAVPEPLIDFDGSTPLFPGDGRKGCCAPDCACEDAHDSDIAGPSRPRTCPAPGGHGDCGGCDQDCTPIARAAGCADQLPAIAERVKTARLAAPRAVLQNTPARPVGRPCQDNTAADPEFQPPEECGASASDSGSDGSASPSSSGCEGDRDDDDGFSSDGDDSEGELAFQHIRAKCSDQALQDFAATEPQRARRRAEEAPPVLTDPARRKQRQQRARNERKRSQRMAAQRSAPAASSGRESDTPSTDAGSAASSRSRWRSNLSSASDADEVAGWDTIRDTGPYLTVETGIFEELLTTRMRCDGDSCVAVFVHLCLPESYLQMMYAAAGRLHSSNYCILRHCQELHAGAPGLGVAASTMGTGFRNCATTRAQQLQCASRASSTC